MKLLLELIIITLTIFSFLSFATHNVADAIFFMVVAIFIRQGLDNLKRRSVSNDR